MRMDWWTRIALTVIAVALAIIAIRPMMSRLRSRRLGDVSLLRRAGRADAALSGWQRAGSTGRS